MVTNLNVKDFDETERITLFIEPKTNTVFLKLKRLSGFIVSFEDCFNYYANLKDSDIKNEADVKTFDAIWINKFNEENPESKVFTTVIMFKNKIIINVVDGNGLDETFSYSRDLLIDIFGYSISVLEYQRIGSM